MSQLFPLSFYWGRSTSYSDRLHDFFVTILRCYNDVYVNSFFPCIARLWNSLPIECFPLTYDLNSFKSWIDRNLLTVGSFFLKRFPGCFYLFVLLFLVTPCLVVAVWLCVEWISIKKKSYSPKSRWKNGAICPVSMYHFWVMVLKTTLAEATNLDTSSYLFNTWKIQKYHIVFCSLREVKWVVFAL